MSPPRQVIASVPLVSQKTSSIQISQHRLPIQFWGQLKDQGQKQFIIDGITYHSSQGYTSALGVWCKNIHAVINKRSSSRVVCTEEKGEQLTSISPWYLISSIKNSDTPFPLNQAH